MHTDKTPVPKQSDSPQYLKGLGKPMPFCSHSEYVAAVSTYKEMTFKHDCFHDRISESDKAELFHLVERIKLHEAHCSMPEKLIRDITNINNRK